MNSVEQVPAANDPEAQGKAEDIWRWCKRQAIGQMDLSFGARECWRIIEGFPPGRCYPSHYFIAEILQKSVSAVRRYLRELKGCGYIASEARYNNDNKRPGALRNRRHKPRGQTSNNYVVLDQPDLIAC